MKLIFSAHKATQRFLVSKQYHLNLGSCHRHLHASNLIVWPKSDQNQSSYLFPSRYYSVSTHQNVTEPSYRLPNVNKHGNHGIKNVDLEIISREFIKPNSPTPHHLRTFNLSIIDQYMYDVYTPLILFLPNIDNASVVDVVMKRSRRLKAALSIVLNRFYPLAGKVKDNLHIECNDKGVCYTEARVNQTLQDFLCHPDDDKVRELVPESPCTTEYSIGNYAISIQVNIFLCGGIGISASVSHKIFDGHTYHIFMKAWAAAARGSNTVSPSFVASKIFPNNPRLGHSLSSKLTATKTLSTKRFVFNSTALPFLKSQPVVTPNSSHPPTRMEATTAVIWKAIAKAASKLRPFGPLSPHALFSAVNLRKRASPHLPEDSIGNLIDGAGAICYPERQLDLPTLMGELRDSIAKINTNHIESMKGEKGHEILRKLKQPMNVTREGDCIMVSSLLNSGMYNLDFGWGKPVWFYTMNAGFDRFLALNEMFKGGGVEAIVTLSHEEMEIFEHDPELLSYASVNPSPLQLLKH